MDQKNCSNYTKVPTPLDKFMHIEDDGVFYIGHASALVRIAGRLLLFDPIWEHKPYGEYWTFYPEQINCDAILNRIDAVFISHIHEDHICEPILSKIRKEVPIHVMYGRPNLTNRIKRLHNNVMEWQPHVWQHTIEGDDDSPYEFFFVQHPFNSIDSSIFVRTDGYCVYVGSDNFLDENRIKTIQTSVPRVDVAMVPYAFIHWYPMLLDSLTEVQKFDEMRRLNIQSLQQAKAFREVFKPNFVIPFGNNLLYAESLDHPLNRYLTWPNQLVEYPIGTGDFVLGDGSQMVYRTANKEVFQPTKFPPMNFRVPNVNPDKIRDKIAGVEARVPNHALIINNIVIDLGRFQVFIGQDWWLEPGYSVTRFELDAPIFEKWVEGEITFEQAIGTRRFSCRRDPNVYNLQVFEFMNNYL